MARKGGIALTISNTESPQKAAIEQGVLDAYEAEGYLLPDGTKNGTMVRERIVEVLSPNKVTRWLDREELSTTRGALVHAVFPSLTGPEDFSEAEDPQLALAVWTVLDSTLWGECRWSASGPIQRLVGLRLGNGWVLARCVIGVDRIGAVYVTADRTCIERDCLAADNKALQRLLERLTANREMLILRQPENGARYAKGLGKQLTALSAASRDRLQLAIEAASSDEEGESPDDSGDGPDED
jgi:hypothetical protein